MAEPAPQTRRDAAAEDARTRILAAAADRIVHDGLAQVRMAGIAKAAGVSSGLLHYHFDTKEQLFAEVLAFCHARSAERTGDALALTGDEPAERLSTFLDRCLPSDPQLREDWLLWQELDLLCLRRPDLARVSANLYETLYAAVEEIIADGAADGVFAIPVEEGRTAAEAAIALCDGLGARMLAPEDLDLEAARAVLVVAVGRLVGHDGPLPGPHRVLQEERR